jgi:hypothetical protein
MATIAVAVWTLTVIRELQKGLRLVDAIRQLPTAAPVRSTATGEHGVYAEWHPKANEVVIVGMTRTRKGVVLLLQILRIALACMLYYIGAVFLVRTWSITEVRAERRSTPRSCALVCASPCLSDKCGCCCCERS